MVASLGIFDLLPRHPAAPATDVFVLSFIGMFSAPFFGYNWMSGEQTCFR